MKVNSSGISESTPVRSNVKRKLVSISAITGFECDLCGKILALKRTLNVHKKCHINKPMYECEICCKKYASKGALKEHMIRHCPDEHIRYRCDQPKCNRKFYHKWRLNAHQNSQHFKNTPESRCDFCNQLLANTFSLKRHRLTCAAYKNQSNSRYSC